MIVEFDSVAFADDADSYRLYLITQFDRVYRELRPEFYDDKIMPWWIHGKTGESVK